MTDSYRVTVNHEDPEVTIRLPMDIVKGLAERSDENGRSIELEVAIRLARSLERDFAMQAEDLKLFNECLNLVSQKHPNE